MTDVRRAGVVLCLLATALTGLGTAAQAPPPEQTSQARPVFTLGVHFVEIDVVVTDGAGAFVRDLRPEDFEVFDSGSRQTVSAFSVVDLPVPEPGAAPEPTDPSRDRANAGAHQY